MNLNTKKVTISQSITILDTYKLSLIHNAPVLPPPRLMLKVEEKQEGRSRREKRDLGEK
jgi:hypothetical protein